MKVGKFKIEVYTILITTFHSALHYVRAICETLRYGLVQVEMAMQGRQVVGDPQ